ncbi:MAG: tetratricopeptide repeat protein [Kiritimatiellia bacterium]
MKMKIIRYGIVLVLGIALGYFAPKLIYSFRYRQIIRNAEQQLSQNPGKAMNWMALGNAKYFNGDRRGALDAYKRALAIDPNYINAYQGIGSYYLDKKDLDQAEEWFKKGLKVAEEHQPEAVFQARQMVDLVKEYRTNQVLQGMYGKGKTQQPASH